MIRDRMVPAKECTCDVCGYQWLSFASIQPKWCGNPQCRSREWNGKKKPSHVNEIKFPAPRKKGRPKTITLLDKLNRED